MSQYESHNLQDRELPFIFKERRQRPSKCRFGSSNWHENIEILSVSEGDGAVFNNGQVYPVSEGDVVIFDANRLHTVAAGERGITYRYLIVDRAFCLANGFDSSAMTFTSKITDARVIERMEELYALYTEEADQRYRILAIRTRVLELMLLLCKEYATPIEHSEKPVNTAAYVKQAIDYIRASYEKDISLDDVAAFVGVSKCYLSREFHQYTGYPFVAYVNRTRCKMAERLLADERLSISEVGRRCGFENRSYFAKCFSRYVGMLPAEYRAKMRTGC